MFLWRQRDRDISPKDLERSRDWCSKKTIHAVAWMGGIRENVHIILSDGSFDKTKIPPLSMLACLFGLRGNAIEECASFLSLKLGGIIAG